jgi:predicted nucleic acid-binding protein
MILVDSSVWIDYFRGVSSWQTGRLHDLLGDPELSIGDLILTEVMQGFSRQSQIDYALDHFDALRFVIIGGRTVALHAASNYRFLRAQGVTIRKTIDTLIATRCILENIKLLHNDRDFDPFEEHLGLHVLKQ